MSRMRHRYARPHARRPYVYRHFAQAHSASSDERVRIAHALLVASLAQAGDPDAAALVLDGVLGDLIDLWARSAAPDVAADRAAALRALDAAAPALAWRVRMALQSRAPEARLTHCWAILEALTTAPTTISVNPSRLPYAPKAHSASLTALPKIRTERMA